MGIDRTYTDVIHEPTTEQIERIKKKIGEDESKFECQLNLLFKWLDSFPQFPKNYDKTKVLNFLRVCKYDMEKCKRKLEAHFYVRYEYPQVFSNLDPTNREITELPFHGNALFFPNLTPNGERIFFLGLHDCDIDNMDVGAFVKYSYMCYDLVLRQPYPVSGDIMILDGSGFTMKHFLKCINTAVKDSIEIAYKGYVVRLKAIYVVNSPPAIDKMIIGLKMFLTDKIKERVVVSKTTDILHEKLPSSCLPEDLGGTLPKANELMRNWYNYILDNTEWFKIQEKCISTERPNYGKSAYDDRFGLDGSFRKLTID